MAETAAWLSDLQPTRSVLRFAGCTAADIKRQTASITGLTIPMNHADRSMTHTEFLNEVHLGWIKEARRG